MSKPFGRRCPCGAGAEDNHFLRRSGGWKRRQTRLFRPDEHAITAPLDFVAGNRVQSRRPEGIPRAQIETRMMPRAAERSVYDESFGERSTIVRAGRPDGAHLRSGE